jgi:hypothetical protein
VVTAGREKEGGAAGYFLCERCNNDAGNWYDPAFGELWNYLAKHLLVEGGMPSYGGPHLLSINGVDPGAVVRSTLSGMMRLNPALRNEYPALQRGVQYRERVESPMGLHLLVALNPDLRLRVAGGRAVRKELWRNLVLNEVVTLSEIAWTPLYLVLTDQSGRTYWDTSQDILPWLADEPGRKRTVDLLVPVLRPERLHTNEMHGGTVVRRDDGVVAVWAPHGEASRIQESLSGEVA